MGVRIHPALQACAFLGDEKKVKGISTCINTEFFYMQQACKHLNGMAEYGYALTPEMDSHVDEIFWSGRQ